MSAIGQPYPLRPAPADRDKPEQEPRHCQCLEPAIEADESLYCLRCRRAIGPER
jgi:hypothetical protein